MAFPLDFLERGRRKLKTRKTLEQLTNAEIRQHCGLPTWAVKEIVELYEPVSGGISTAIPLETKVLVFLSHLRSGSFQWVLGSGCGVSQPSASRIIEACCNRTLELATSVIKFPETAISLNTIKQNFFDIARIPNVVGVVDGTHIPILAPSINEPAYVNRKQIHSINCQVIAGPDYQLFDVVAKWPGSSHDSFIWGQSGVRESLYDKKFGDSFFIGIQHNFVHVKDGRNLEYSCVSSFRLRG